MRLNPQDLEKIADLTLEHYNRRAEDFWEGMRDHDVSQQAGAGGGLGFFIWNSYVGGSYEQIVVGMISIGVAGFASSELLRWAGRYATPWLKAR